MEIDNLKETLTKKYGPLPGYAWVGIGAGGILVVSRLHKGKGASASGTPVNVSPLSAGGVDGSSGGVGDLGAGGGGGGGGVIPPDTQPLPPNVFPFPTDTGGGGDDLQVTGGASDGHTDTIHAAPSMHEHATALSNRSHESIKTKPKAKPPVKVKGKGKINPSNKPKPPVKKAPELISEHGQGQNKVKKHVASAAVGTAPVSNSTSVMHVAPVTSVAPSNKHHGGLQMD